MKRSFLSGLVILTAVGCTSRKHCNSIDAQLLGAQDGRAFDASQKGLQRGAVCTEDYSVTSFRKDYENGYDKALRDSCSMEGATNLALHDIRNSDLTKSSAPKLQVCQAVGANLKGLQAAYDQTYLKGMCTNDKVKIQAAEHGAKYADPNLDYVDQICAAAGNRAELTRTYKSAYTDALKTACDFGGIKIVAQNDARKKVSQETRFVDLSKCPGDSWNIKQLYSSTYETETLKIKIEEEQRLRQEAERMANERANVVLRCEIIAVNKVEISLNNLNGRQIRYLNGVWNIRLIDKKGRLVSIGQQNKPITLEAGETTSFKQDFKAREVSKATQCDVRFIDQTG